MHMHSKGSLVTSLPAKVAFLLAFFSLFLKFVLEKTGHVQATARGRLIALA